MRRLSRLGAATIGALLTLTGLASAQTAPTQTTLSAAITTTSATQMSVTSATGFATTDTPAGYLKMALIDRELVGVRSISGTVIQITRGLSGTRVSTHASGATITVSAPAAFQTADVSAEGYPTSGSCTAGNELYLPVYNVHNGRRWNCIGGLWMVDNGIAVLPPSACVSTVSGNSTGTNGLTVAGASNTAVMQAQTSATGTNTHTYSCTLNAAVWGGLTTTIVRQVVLQDVVFLYGVQGGALGTQVATLASGTMNSSTVFASIAYPTAAASETASTVTPVRADAGTLTITPVVASANTATTTAGGFYSTKFTPATPFAMATDLKQVLLTVTLQAAATTATTTNTPGVIVHFAYIPD